MSGRNGLRGSSVSSSRIKWKFPDRFLRRLQKSIQRRVHGTDDSEELEMEPSDQVTSPLLEKSPSLPLKVQRPPHFKLNRQPRVVQYHSLESTSPKKGASASKSALMET